MILCRMVGKLPRQRRHKLYIYYVILAAVAEVEVENDGRVAPTRLQHLSMMSYDKLKGNLTELEGRGLLSMKDGNVQITDRGREFMRNYDSLSTLMGTMGLR